MTLIYKVENQVLHPCGPMRPTIELSRNVVYLELAFDAEWDGASVTVLFEHSSLQAPVAVLWTGEPVAVPGECLVTGELRIGCVGLKDGGETRITTARMERSIFVHRCGGIFGIDPEEQTPELWEQVMAAIGQLSDLKTTDKTTIVAAINEVLSKVSTGGTIAPDAIAQAVEDYLAANPPAQGEPGPQGPQGVQGEIGPQGPQGVSGVYVGSGDMPEGYNVQIDPTGSPSESMAIDTSLTKSGQAADAKATGDAINSLSEEKANLPLAEDGTINAGISGQYATSDGEGGFNWEDGPATLPNPNALTFTGAVTGSYDGSSKISARIPQVVSWANKELFDKADLIDPGNKNSFVTVDGVEYYRYHAGATYGFTWNNPHPLPGSVTITARGVSQYGGSGGTRLKTIYDDGTYGPDLYIVVSGESKTATVTTDASKTLAKITGNYDLENWVLLDMSVMSIVANYNVGVPLADSNVPGGIKADPATETDTVPAKIGADGKLYVPDMSGGGGGIVSGDYIPVPSTAEVGQTIVVKAVDENGKPTEWEAADMASGGGDNWKLLVDFESTEEIAANTGMVFDTADDGTPINAKEIIIDWYCPAAAQVAYATFKVNNVQCTGYAQSTPAYFWSGILISTNAKAATLYFRPLTDVCLLTSDTNASLVPVWFAKTGAFETITSLQLTMFGGTYPVGLKIKILGR